MTLCASDGSNFMSNLGRHGRRSARHENLYGCAGLGLHADLLTHQVREVHVLDLVDLHLGVELYSIVKVCLPK